MNGCIELSPHFVPLQMGNGKGASLTCQRLVNRFRIKSAEALLPDDNNG
jgi:hypothetical protein